MLGRGEVAREEFERPDVQVGRFSVVGVARVVQLGRKVAMVLRKPVKEFQLEVLRTPEQGGARTSTVSPKRYTADPWKFRVTVAPCSSE